jgi:hypothetical protein
MVPGSAQPLAELSTRNLPGGKWWPARKADITAMYEPILWKMLEPRSLTTLRSPWHFIGIALSFYIYKQIKCDLRF